MTTKKKARAAAKPKRPKVVKQTVRDLDAKSDSVKGGGVVRRGCSAPEPG